MRTLIKLLIGLVVVVVAAAAVGEALARYFVGREVSEPLSDTWQTSVSTSFGTQPLIPGLLNDRVGEMTIESDTITRGSLSGSSVLIKLDGTDISDRANPVSEQVNITARVTTQTILESIEAQGGGGVQLPLGVVVTIDDVVARPDRNAIEVVLGEGAASVFVTPLVQNGEIVTETDGGTIFGFPIPDEIFSAIRSGTQESVAVLPDGLVAERVEVTDGGVDVYLAGQSLALSELNNAQP
ncbi:LmeA family phospholipid-binding protein [Hoyosella altamirensis]|uniref:DUF2993 domain-containing protein n=1 Tax=Hoyosella altamirensis TaxID=616997 RepID=A0A839RJC8_9ACTN|nr:LmeA family phospholipid-binding protein [Hoyosella altamirensis]MBB3036560.1 hypothetical protein [Hoyosella altamirensis]